MSNERDELADVIRASAKRSLGSLHIWPADVANAILAAGYRKPRTVTTAEDLDALPDGSIILELDGNASRAVKRQDGKNWWIDGPDAMSSSALIPLPATVLHEGAQS